MKIDKSLITGSTTMLLLKLLEKEDLYGYEMIEALEAKSNHTFTLKAGTLYPLLHGLVDKEVLECYEKESGGRNRKYYHLTKSGKKLLAEKESEWNAYASAVKQVLGGALYAY